MPRWTEHDRVPRGLPAKAVRGGILLVVRLDLDDPPADAAAKQRGPDQPGSDRVHRPREEVATERRHASLSRFAS
jgi:hypothetical protein